ncbi:Aste57867_16815 [Aphanomyces stellatus]|uniref:Aste57867_16815 protein n=1 Tax=Aphanomyces stellatus TaxID=120398 RepID=A0A485L783_9STRA|nr:hypothetical protein As57867_016757 [Aphanomyces stellatus]VFT93580.1 Aste57867_16815 [Aphanomyces stellatus]
MPTDASPDDSIESLAREVVHSLVSTGCRLVCIDFDATFLRIHTNGEWSESADELRSHVRYVSPFSPPVHSSRGPISPLFLNLLPLLAQHPHIAIAVVTFSPQVALIRQVISLCFGSTLSDAIILRGDDSSWSLTHDQAVLFTGIDAHHLPLNRRNKFPYVASAALEASRRHAASDASTPAIPPCGTSIQSCHTVLIDDCEDNVFLASQCGISAIHYEPTQFPERVHAELKRRRKRKPDDGSSHGHHRPRHCTGAVRRLSLQSPPPKPRLPAAAPSSSSAAACLTTPLSTPSKDTTTHNSSSSHNLARRHLCTPSPVMKLKVSNSIGRPKPKRYSRLRSMAEARPVDDKDDGAIATTLHLAAYH